MRRTNRLIVWQAVGLLSTACGGRTSEDWIERSEVDDTFTTTPNTTTKVPRGFGDTGSGGSSTNKPRTGYSSKATGGMATISPAQGGSTNAGKNTGVGSISASGGSKHSPRASTAAGAPATGGALATGGNGNSTELERYPTLTGRYELKLGASAPWVIDGHTCPDLRTTSPIPITFRIMEDAAGFGGWLAPEWQGRIEMELVEIRGGVLHAELESWRSGTTLGVTVDEVLKELNVPLDEQGHPKPGTALIRRRCHMPNDVTDHEQTVEVSAIPTPDRTPPRFRVLDDYFSGPNAPESVAPWIDLTLQASEPLDGIEYTEYPKYVELHATSDATPTAVTWRDCDSDFQWCYGHLANPDQVNGTEQQLVLKQPVDDGAGNLSKAGTLMQTFHVMNVGPSHTSLEFDGPTSIALWGEAEVRAPGDPLCESGGCLVLGPALTFACPRDASVDTGFAARLQLPAAKVLKMRARVEQSSPQAIIGYGVECGGIPDGGSLWHVFEEALPGGSAFSPLPVADGELRYTTAWGTVSETFGGGSSPEAFVSVSLPGFECESGFESGWLRVIIDRVWVE